MNRSAWSEGLARRLERISPITAFLAWLVAGVVLIVLSYACNLASVEGPQGLRLGYLYEINWIWNFGFTVPCAVAGVFLTISSARQAVLGLVSAGMITDASGRALGAADVEQSWRAVFGRFLRWGAGASAAGVAVSYAEWATVSVRPLLSGSVSRPGWFVGSLVNGTPKWENIGFGFLAYTMQGLGVALFLLYVFTVAAFASWVYQFTTRDEPLEMLPDTASDDPRRGFQVLEPFVTNMLYCGLGFFMVFFVNRVHFLFLNQSHFPPDYPSVYQFFVSEVLGAMGKDVAAIFDAKGARFFEIGGGDNFTVVITTIGLLSVVAISVLVPVTILLQAAQRARARNLVFLQNNDVRAVNPRRQSSADQLSRLSTMQVWPVNYPKPVLLIALAIVASTSYVFYRLTFVLLVVCLAASFRAIVRVLRNLDAGARPRNDPPAVAIGSELLPRRASAGEPIAPRAEVGWQPPVK